MKISNLFLTKKPISFSFIVFLFLFFLSSCASSEVETPFSSVIDKEKLSKQVIPNTEKSDASKYEKQRLLYIEALESYEIGDLSAVKSLMRSKLKNYPLNIYLEYQLLQTKSASITDVISFINSGKHEVLANRLKAYYISVYAKNKQYSNLLKISPKLPNTPSFQCLWYAAKYHTGQKSESLKYIRNVYTSGANLTGGCLDFASELRKFGVLTSSDLYERLDSAYWTRNGNKVYTNSSYLLKKTQYKNAVTILDKLYNSPQKYNSIPTNMKSVATTVFKRYSRIEPLSAYAEFAAFKKKYAISAKQEKSIERVMISAMLYEKNDVPYSYVDRKLAQINSTPLYEHRIRTAIWQKDYKTVEKFINVLPKDIKDADNYRYWLARSLMAQGKKNQAKAIYEELAKVRSFYGYLAADAVNKPYAINDANIKITKSRATLIKNNPSYARFVELDLLNDARGVKTEWRELMSKASLEDARMIATIEAKRGYTDLAVWESIYKKDWDSIKLRLPLTFIDIYKDNARNLNLSMSFLLGITRQESIMNPFAISPVGARGLMQIMPSTATVIAKKNQYKYSGPNSLLTPKVNVLYGSTYIKELLGQFNDNRIYVAAAYNAGPNRAYRWQSKDGIKRDIATYVESIPFDETRNYVQKVIFYDYLYQYLLGNKKKSFLTDAERHADY